MMMMSPRAWATSIHAASSTVKGTTWKKALLHSLCAPLPLSTLQRLQHQHNGNHNDGNERHLEWRRPCLASQNRLFTHRRQLLSTSAQIPSPKSLEKQSLNQTQDTAATTTTDPPNDSTTTTDNHNNPAIESNNHIILTPHELSQQQSHLLNEASSLTRTLYRKCLRSIQTLSHGNDRDETDFTEREHHDLNAFSEDGGSNGSGSSSRTSAPMRISMAPPVNRQNELSSRANYYKSFTREHFDGHFGLLHKHGFYLGDQDEEHGTATGDNNSNKHHNNNNGTNGELQGQLSKNIMRDGQYQGGHHHLGHQFQMSRRGDSAGGNEDLQSSSSSSNSSSSGSGSNSGSGSSSDSSRPSHYYMWREEQIEKFIYLIQSGEEKRRWILDDYEFSDPCNPSSDDDDGDEEQNNLGWTNELERRLTSFESNAYSLVKSMYREKGWMHSSDLERLSSLDDEDFGSNDDDDDDL